jgi:large subunit ribosomal protein L31
MKEGIHPQWYPEAKVIVEGEVVMTVGSTVPEISVEIWSGTHPFYTGTQRLLDTEGQVDRFMRRLQRREELRVAVEEEAEKRDPSMLTVDSMSLGTRATNALVEAEVTTVGDVLELLEKGDDALLALPGIGQKALIDIKRFLRNEHLI